MLWRLIKALFFLAVLAGIGLVGFAYVGPILFPTDFAAPGQQVTATVTLDAQ
ncbi:hypothetical protein [Limimaricola sp.]|uniref:hypothetical protein n=1 Tax=Limimaricola sp. TaxID=2211665 RepID=UPI0025B80ED2|nr:hypothetical protein [Limimaricola sp.]